MRVGARTCRSATALLFKGATISYGQLDRESTAFAAALSEHRRSQGRSGRAPAAQLPAVLRRGVRRVEGRRNRRRRESDLHRARAGAGPRLDRRRDRRHAHAVLHAGQGRPGTDRRQARHRDVDQGIPAAGAAPALHALQGSQGRPSHHHRERRPLAPGSAAPHRQAPRPAVDRQPATIAPSFCRAAARPARRRASSACIGTTSRPACSCTSGRSRRSSRGPT